MRNFLKTLPFLSMMGALAIVITITSYGYDMDMIRFMLLANISLVFMILKLFSKRKNPVIFFCVPELAVVGYCLTVFLAEKPTFYESSGSLLHQVFIGLIIASMGFCVILMVYTLFSKDKKHSKTFNHGLY
jgi:hypothetical protein